MLGKGVSAVSVLVFEIIEHPNAIAISEKTEVVRRLHRTLRFNLLDASPNFILEIQRLLNMAYHNKRSILRNQGRHFLGRSNTY